MDVMARRREILAANNGGYVRSGLILWMDGIDKGPTAGAWTDKAAGHVFTSVNGFTDGENYVGLNASASQYLRNQSFQPPDGTKCTIEVAMSDYQTRTLVFMPVKLGYIAFGVYGSNDTIISAAETGISTVSFTPGAKVFSIVNNVRAIVDGKAAQFGSTNAWGGADQNYNNIGRRSTGNYFTGKLYSIRIYNRHLTQAEILRNQRIDNKRFGLGLSI